MNAPSSSALPGRVASLHLHPPEPGAPLQNIDVIEVVEGKGIRNDTRYFGRLNRSTGQPSRRQVSLIEREQVASHAAALGRESIAPGAVRANIETLGVNLLAWVGRQVQVGEAILFLYEPRMPCEKMDAVCPGLRELMKNNQQGVLAQVLRSGMIREGDSISVLG
jgi:MOSC domain-containing protein YiiM